MTREKEINLMKCWLIRNAALRWHKSPVDIAALFKKYALYGYVTDCYELMHVSSYECALDELEEVLAANGVEVYAKA